MKRLAWRVQSDDAGGFDEIVVGHGDSLILHAEMMNERSCFIDVAGICFWVVVEKNGVATIANREDRRGENANRRVRHASVKHKSKCAKGSNSITCTCGAFERARCKNCMRVGCGGDSKPCPAAGRRRKS